MQSMSILKNQIKLLTKEKCRYIPTSSNSGSSDEEYVEKLY